MDDEVHVTELTVWDVPSATVAGEQLRFVLGARCSAGCNLGGKELGIYDLQGACVARTKLGRDVWPGTEALYVAEVQASAPAAAGSHQWEVKAAGWDTEAPHVAGSYPVAVRVVDAPDCLVTVTALDRESREPIAGARVVMHPYRAVADASGIARVRVAKGQYDILVSGSGHAAACISVEVSADMAASAELEVDQPWIPPDEEIA